MSQLMYLKYDLLIVYSNNGDRYPRGVKENVLTISHVIQLRKTYNVFRKMVTHWV